MNVPDGWAVVRLGQLGKLIGGGTPSRTREDFFGGQIPWLTGQDIPEDSVEIVTKGREQITEEAIRDSATNLVPAGTLLVTTRVSVGKTAVTGCPLCFSQDVSALRLHDSKLASPEFLALYLRFQRERIVSRNQGSTISGITRDGLAAEKLPLPSLKEQERIVTVLREAAELRRIRTQIYETTKLLVPSIFDEMFGSATAWTHHQKLELLEVEWVNFAFFGYLGAAFLRGLESCRAQSPVLSRRLFVRARRAAATGFRALSRVAAGRHA